MPHSGPRGFWIFFNEIMMGKEKTINKKCSFLAEITIDQIQEKLTSITREFTQKIDQDVVNKSEINIYCGSDNTTLKDYQLLQNGNIIFIQVKLNLGQDVLHMVVVLMYYRIQM